MVVADWNGVRRRARALPAWALDGAAIAIAALLVLVSLSVQGRPMVFPDTDDYFMEGEGIVQVAGDFITKGKLPFDPANVEQYFKYTDRGDQEPIHNQDGARSAYYGFFLFVLQAIGTTWLVAFVQAAATAWAMFMLWRLTAPRAPRWSYVALMGVLAAGTTLPFIAGFAMPDAFTGVAVITALCLFIYDDRLTRPQRISLWAVLAFALNVHTSHILLTGSLTLAAAGALALMKVDRASLIRRGGMIAAAAVVAMAANAAYGFAIRIRTGDQLRSPPFLMVRMLADGPGRAYLRSECGRTVHYEVCRFKHLELTNSNQIMWSSDPEVGIFNSSDFLERNRLKDEEPAFVLGVMHFDPVGQITASLKNWGGQLANISIGELIFDPRYYLNDPYWRTTNLPRLILDVGPCSRHHRECVTRFRENSLLHFHWAVIFAAFGFLGWRLSRPDVRNVLLRRERDSDMSRVLLVLGLLLLAVVANAAICGAISGVFGRYQARIVWIVPAVAALAAVALPSALRAPRSSSSETAEASAAG